MLQSDDVRVPRYRATNFAKAREELRAALPTAHVKFLCTLKLSLSRGRYFFCHAGVRPGEHLDCQSEEDLLWIREPFLASTVDFGKIVVHGHSPVPETGSPYEPDCHRHRRVRDRQADLRSIGQWRRTTVFKGVNGVAAK